MRIIGIGLIIYFGLNSIVFGQCNVKMENLDTDIVRYSMTETFFKNEDLENGINGILLSTNLIALGNSKGEVIIEIVATYTYNGMFKSRTPNKLNISLSNGSSITLIAKEKSNGTLNRTRNIPSETHLKSVEGIFDISLDDVSKIVDAKNFRSLTLEDYKTNYQWNLTNNYKGQIAEMLSCVVNENDN